MRAHKKRRQLRGYRGEPHPQAAAFAAARRRGKLRTRALGVIHEWDEDLPPTEPHYSRKERRKWGALLPGVKAPVLNQPRNLVGAWRRTGKLPDMSVEEFDKVFANYAEQTKYVGRMRILLLARVGAAVAQAQMNRQSVQQSSPNVLNPGPNFRKELLMQGYRRQLLMQNGFSPLDKVPIMNSADHNVIGYYRRYLDANVKIEDLAKKALEIGDAEEKKLARKFLKYLKIEREEQERREKTVEPASEPTARAQGDVADLMPSSKGKEPVEGVVRSRSADSPKAQAVNQSGKKEEEKAQDKPSDSSKKDESKQAVNKSGESSTRTVHYTIHKKAAPSPSSSTPPPANLPPDGKADPANKPPSWRVTVDQGRSLLDGIHPHDSQLTTAMEVREGFSYAKVQGVKYFVHKTLEDKRLVSDRETKIVPQDVVVGVARLFGMKYVTWSWWRWYIEHFVATESDTGQWYRDVVSYKSWLRAIYQPKFLDVAFVPHLLSVASAEYSNVASPESVMATARQKCLRAPVLPLPDTMAADALNGTEYVLSGVVAERDLNPESLNGCVPLPDAQVLRSPLSVNDLGFRQPRRKSTRSGTGCMKLSCGCLMSLLLIGLTVGCWATVQGAATLGLLTLEESPATPRSVLIETISTPRSEPTEKESLNEFQLWCVEQMKDLGFSSERCFETQLDSDTPLDLDRYYFSRTTRAFLVGLAVFLFLIAVKRSCCRLG